MNDSDIRLSHHGDIPVPLFSFDKKLLLNFPLSTFPSS